MKASEFRLNTCGNAADTAGSCQLTNYSHAEKDLKRNKKLKLNLVLNT